MSLSHHEQVCLKWATFREILLPSSDLTLVIPGGGQTGPRHWFFARCTLTGRAISLKFYGFSSNSIPGQKFN